MKIEVTLENKRGFTRRQILDAAFGCFAEYGYAKTTFTDVAKKAGISRSLLYLYFKEKKDLFIAMTGEIHDKCAMQSQEVLSSDLSKKEKLRKIIDIWIISVHRVIDRTPSPNAWIDALQSVRQSELRYRELFAESLAPLTGRDLADVVVLSIKGLVHDRPPAAILEKRTDILINAVVHNEQRQTRSE